MIFVVGKCVDCPFHYETDKRRCNVAIPKGRPILDDSAKPSWCPLKKEQFIVREKSE